MNQEMHGTKRTTHLYSMVICPFAQRTRIHLQMKGIPFELINLDICKPRPSWFLSLNPTGQVPVLTVDEDIVCDSTLISEYVEEKFPHPLPFGKSPADRAMQRALIKYIDTKFIPALYMLMSAQTVDEHEVRTKAALETWKWINDFLQQRGYRGGFLGETFGLPEVSIAPFFLRYNVVSYYQDFELPGDAEYECVREWRAAVLQTAIVHQTAESTGDLIKMYEDYTLGYYNGAIPPGKKASSSDLSIPLKDRALPPKATLLRQGNVSSRV